MPIGLVAAGVGVAGAIGGAVISGNATKSAAQTSANASLSAQQEQARQFNASQEALRTGTANANDVQTQQHDASVAGLGAASQGAIDEQRAALGDVQGVQAGLYGNSIDTINKGYTDAKAANDPFLTSGTSALNRLSQIYGLDSTDAAGNKVAGTPGGNLDPNATFYQTPDYQFKLSQGVKGVDAGAAARGMLDSGATRKAEITYAGNLASGQFNDYASRLAALAGVGQTAAGNNAAGTTNYVNAITGANNSYGSQYGNLRTGVANNISNNMTGTAGQIAGANNSYATQYGNAQMGLGTDIANSSTNYGNNYASSVTSAANNQANAGLVQGANASNAINGAAGTAAQYLNSNYAGKSVFGSSYVPAAGSNADGSMFFG